MAHRGGVGRDPRRPVAAPGTLCLAVAIVAVLAAGALNATLNGCAISAVAGDTRRFVRYHAAYSAGAFGGAVLTALIAGGGASWRVVWLTLVLAGLALAVPASHVDSGSTAPTVRVDFDALGPVAAAHTGSRRVAVLLFAAVAAASAVDTWGVRFLRVEHDTSIVGGAGAYAVAQLVAVVARLRLVPSSNVRRADPVVVASGLLAAGLIVECSISNMWISAAGLAAAAVAGALVVPLLLACSGIGERPAAAVAAVGAVGHLGFVIGPALVGALTALVGSAAGLLAVASLAVVTAAAARWGLAVDGTVRVDDSEVTMSRQVEQT